MEELLFFKHRGYVVGDCVDVRGEVVSFENCCCDPAMCPSFSVRWSCGSGWGGDAVVSGVGF